MLWIKYGFLLKGPNQITFTSLDNNKSHNHSGVISTKDLGTKTTSTDTHTHTTPISTRATAENASNTSGSWRYLFNDGTTIATLA